MSKTKFGKKIVSLVLALTMLFAVSVSAISASAYGPVGKAISLADDLVSTHGYGPGPIQQVKRAKHVIGLGIAKKVLPAHDDLAIDIADKITDVAVKGARDGVKLAALNALPLSVKNGVATQIGLSAVDLAEQAIDVKIIADDAKLLTFSTAFKGLEDLLIAQHNWQLIVAGAYALPAKTIGTLKILKNVNEVGLDNLGVLAGEALVIRGLLPAHLKLLPVPHVHSIIPGSPLTVAGKLISFNTGLLLRNVSALAIPFDVADIAIGGLIFNTPIADTQFVLNAALIPRHLFNRTLGTAGQLTGLASIGLGSALFIKNGLEVATEFIPATIAANATRHVTEAAIVAGLTGLHIADNIFWNVLGGVLLAKPLVDGAALTSAAALGAGALGLAGLTVANVAGAAALAAPVAGAAIATPVALGAGALGLGGLAAAGLAGAAALAAPVVATAVAAPVVGAAALGTAAAGAAALGAGALGAAALAANVLGNKDGSTTNPVDTVKNAVESVVPSNNQTTTTTATESTENTQNDNTQAQTTSSNTGSNVANTDGPMD